MRGIHGCTAPGGRRTAWPAATCLAAALAALAAGTPLLAEGPALPLEIDVDLEEGLVLFLVDTAQIADARVERQFYRDGELLEREELRVEMSARNPRYQREGEKWLESRTGLLEFGKVLMGHEPGAYAQRLVVEGRWAAQAEARLREERWVHFVVDDKGVRPVSLREYSNRVDMPDVALDSEGRKSLVYVGRGPEESERIEETKHYRDDDLQFGLREGVAPEKVDRQRLQLDEAAKDVSEKDEN